MIVPTEKNSAPSVVLVSPAPASPIIQKQPAIAVMVNPAKTERIPTKQTITPRPDQTITLHPGTRMSVPTEKIPAPSVALVSPAPASSVVQKQSRIKLVAPIRSTVKTVAKVESTEKTVPLQSGMPNINDGADPHNNFLRHLHEKDVPLASTSPNSSQRSNSTANRAFITNSSQRSNCTANHTFIITNSSQRSNSPAITINCA